jgi:hypothetical protein
MIDIAADIGNDRDDISAAVGLGLVVDEDPDRLVEFPDPLGFPADLQFSLEGDLEKAVLDLVIREVAALGRTPAGDLGAFCVHDRACRTERRQRKRQHREPSTRQ